MPKPVLCAMALCIAAMAAACGGGTESSQEDAAAEARGSVIGDPLHQALDRAQSVQDTVDARAAELRQRVEEAEGD